MNSLPKENSILQPHSSQSSLIELSDSTPADTPQGVIQLLHRIRTDAERGLRFLYDAECKLADAEAAYERELQLAFINAQGTVADRTAVSRLQASDKRLEADLAKAEYNRVKGKLKGLEMAQMSVQTQARLMETELKTLK